MYHLDDNIAAIASAAGGAARGIVRASGPTVVSLCAELDRSRQPRAFEQLRRPVRLAGAMRVPEFSAAIPGAWHIWPSSRSYTGEPLVEWHVLGSPPLVEASLRAICRAGARLAERGEFTLRAFLAGRIDLTQAEAVLGVIDAHDPADLKTALAQLSGGLAQPLARVRHDLLDLLVELEAGLDFVEEGLDFVAADEVRRRLRLAQAEIDRVAARIASRGASQLLPRVILRGWPNAGKSSLFNALARHDAALVSPQAGTTRDYLEATLECGNIRCRLIDTAGIMPEEAGVVDRAAQVSADRQLELGELELLCLDASRPLNAWERSALTETSDRPRIIVLTKHDLGAERASNDDSLVGAEPVITSSRSGAGLDALRARITTELCRISSGGGIVAATALRSRESIDQAALAIAAAREAAEQQLGEELVAAELRAALQGLAAVVGAVYTNELLDGIFSRFCIGK